MKFSLQLSNPLLGKESTEKGSCHFQKCQSGSQGFHGETDSPYLTLHEGDILRPRD